jgi:hypothetical protein
MGMSITEDLFAIQVFATVHLMKYDIVSNSYHYSYCYTME